MLQNRIKSAYVNPGLNSPQANQKFMRIFRHQLPIDYTAYASYKRPAAYRWASTWGMRWNPKSVRSGLR